MIFNDQQKTNEEMSHHTNDREDMNEVGAKPRRNNNRKNTSGGKKLVDLNSEKVVQWSDIRKFTHYDLIEKAENQRHTEYFKDADLNSMKKQDLLIGLSLIAKDKGQEIVVEGIFDIMPDGYGFLRFKDCDYLSSGEDVYVSHALIRKFQLRVGDEILGTIRIPKQGEKYFAVDQIFKLNNEEVGSGPMTHRPLFDKMVPLYPNKRIVLKSSKKADELTLRMIDVLAPIGFGQRALIVAPPKTGKTEIMKAVAHAVSENHPDSKLFVLLIDERPEEVTDMERSVNGEVVSSTFDEHPARHVQIAEMTIERAKRLVEKGKDVVILLDAMTRLARAYNTVVPSSGKVLSGGVEATALQKPKRFFGAARNIENGGSLTIISTALIETHSKMDEVIFEEFKGTGNSEIQLSRSLAERGTFPAIVVNSSSTRKDDLLLDDAEIMKRKLIRRVLSDMSLVDSSELLLKRLKESKDNEAFFNNLSK